MDKTTVIIIREDSTPAESFSTTDIWLTNIAICLSLGVIFLFVAMWSAVMNHVGLFETIVGFFYHLAR